VYLSDVSVGRFMHSVASRFATQASSSPARTVTIADVSAPAALAVPVHSPAPPQLPSPAVLHAPSLFTNAAGGASAGPGAVASPALVPTLQLPPASTEDLAASVCGTFSLEESLRVLSLSRRAAATAAAIAEATMTEMRPPRARRGAAAAGRAGRGAAKTKQRPPTEAATAACEGENPLTASATSSGEDACRSGAVASFADASGEDTTPTTTDDESEGAAAALALLSSGSTGDDWVDGWGGAAGAGAGGVPLLRIPADKWVASLVFLADEGASNATGAGVPSSAGIAAARTGDEPPRSADDRGSSEVADEDDEEAEAPAAKCPGGEGAGSSGGDGSSNRVGGGGASIYFECGSQPLAGSGMGCVGVSSGCVSNDNRFLQSHQKLYSPFLCDLEKCFLTYSEGGVLVGRVSWGCPLTPAFPLPASNSRAISLSSI